MHRLAMFSALAALAVLPSCGQPPPVQAPAPPPAPLSAAEWEAITDPPDAFRIIDGDTFALQGETFRISNIDTPEAAPRSECDAEAILAVLATQELETLWEESRRSLRLRVTREGEDRYGRTLARVTFDGETDVGEAMIARGVAVPWAGRRHDWCATS